LSFKDVDLFRITTNNKFVFEGNLNGQVDFKQNNAVYKPYCIKQINLSINKTDLELLNFDIEGDQI
jgi:hypothetical protein